MVVKRFNEGIEDVYSFYNNSDSLFRNIFNHRFYFMSKACDYTWKAVLASSILLSVFGDNKYNDLKSRVLPVGVAAFVAGNIFYGAFWSKLGSMNILRDSWRTDKKITSKKILAGIAKGNLYNYYYKYRVIDGFYNELSLGALGFVGKKSPLARRGIEFIANSLSRVM